MATLLYVVAFIAMLWAALSALPAGLEAHMPMPYMIALTPFLWVPLAALAAFGAWRGEWGAVCCLLVAACMASSQRISYWGTSLNPMEQRRESRRETSRETPHRASTEPRDNRDSRYTGPIPTCGQESDSPSLAADRETSRETLPAQFAVMTLNCRYGQASAADIIDQIRSRHIDVLALQEVTDTLIDRLMQAGIGETLPYRQLGVASSGDNGGFNALFSRYEPGASVPNVVDIPAADVPAITLRIEGEASETSTESEESENSKDSPGRTITFCSAHPKSPMRGCQAWSAGILGLGALTQAQAIGDHNIVVVMGDLNSGTDHPSFRALLKSGFKDASLTQATGPNTTYPRWLPWPRIELDHVLFTPGLKPSGVRSLMINDTDHLAVVATLTLG